MLQALEDGPIIPSGAVRGTGRRGRADERAAQLTGALEAAYEAVGYQIEDADRLFLERYMERARSSISESAFARATREGRAMSLTRAVALALEPTRPA